MVKTNKKVKQKKQINKKVSEIEYLETLIGFSERAVTIQNNNVDAYFKAQAQRLRGEVNKLKGKQ